MNNLLPQIISKEDKFSVPQYVRNDVNLYHLPYFSNRKWEIKPRKIEIVVEKNNDKLSWRVLPHPDIGTPAFFEKKVFYAFLSVIEQKGLSSFLVPFTFREIARQMNIAETGPNIKNVKNVIERLKATVVESEGIFYSKEKKSKIYDFFSLVDRVILKDEKYEDPETGKTKIAETNFLVLGSWLYSNLKNGYIAQIDYPLFQKMKPLEARLYEFLLPNFYPIITGNNKTGFVKKSYSELCKYLPAYEYKSKAHIEREFTIHIESLIKKGILSDFRLHRINDKKDWVFYFYPNTEKAKKKKLHRQQSIRFISDKPDNKPNKEAPTQPLNPKVQMLIARGITESTAQILVKNYPDRIIKQVDIFDWLKEKDDCRIAKNPAGYLRKSIEVNYTLPKGYISKEQKLKIKERQTRQREAEEEYRLAEKSRTETEKVLDAKVDEITSNLSEEEYKLLWQRAEQKAKEQYLETFCLNSHKCIDVKMKEIIRTEHLKEA